MKLLLELMTEAILRRLRRAIAPVIAVARKRAAEADIVFKVINSYPGLETSLDEAVVRWSPN